MSYNSDIKKIQNLTVKDMTRVATQYVVPQYKLCPWAFCDSRGRTLEHGTAVLET